MPLTEKGQEIMQNMKEEYGAEKGEQVFYASRNTGHITGVDNISSCFSAYDPYELHHGLPIDEWIDPMAQGSD